MIPFFWITKSIILYKYFRISKEAQSQTAQQETSGNVEAVAMSDGVVHNPPRGISIGRKQRGRQRSFIRAVRSTDVLHRRHKALFGSSTIACGPYAPGACRIVTGCAVLRSAVWRRHRPANGASPAYQHCRASSAARLEVTRPQAFRWWSGDGSAYCPMGARTEDPPMDQSDRGRLPR
jgi:hypothetical protein